MRKAWKRVKANGGAPGVDGITIGEFPTYAKTDWVEIKTSLLNGAYKPCPVKRVEIPKDNGGTRNLGIPVVMDRVIQSRKLSGISQILTPVFDPHFSESSFGFRANRSAHQAVRNVLKLIQRGYAYVPKAFGINHDILMNPESIREESATKAFFV